MLETGAPVTAPTRLRRPLAPEAPPLQLAALTIFPIPPTMAAVKHTCNRESPGGTCAYFIFWGNQRCILQLSVTWNRSTVKPS